jgi:hypothetical protein
LLEAALMHARNGRLIHPLIPGSKKPLIEDWPSRATCDESQVKEWWAEWPDANIGWKMGADLLAIDVDSKAGGLQRWIKLIKEHGYTGPGDLKTLLQQTPHYGLHYVFTVNGQKYGNSRGKLPKDIDVRSGNGYIALAPSKINGQEFPYTLIQNGQLLQLPEWLAELLEPSTPSRLVVEDDREYTEQDLKRGLAYFEQGRERNLERLRSLKGWGDGWDATTFEVCCRLVELANAKWTGEYGLDDVLSDVMSSSPKFDPTWEIGQIREKLESAVRIVGGRPRAFPKDDVEGLALGMVSEVLPDSVLQLKKLAEKAELPIRSKNKRQKIDDAVITADKVTVEDPTFLWEGYIEASGLAVLVGDGGVGKGMLSAWMIAQLSNGTLPGLYQGKPMKCLYASTEENYYSATVPRLLAQQATLGRVGLLDVSKYMLQLDEQGIPELLAYMKKSEYNLIILDPIIDYFPAGLTDSEINVRSVLSPLQRQAREDSITVLGVRHVPKGNSTIEDMIMGSKAWRNTARSALGIIKHPDEPSTRVVFNIKMNNSAEGEEGQGFSIEGKDVPPLKKPVGHLVWDKKGYSRNEMVEMAGLTADIKEEKIGKRARQVAVLEEYMMRFNGEVGSKNAVEYLMETCQVSQPTAYRIGDSANVEKKGNTDGTWKLPEETIKRLRHRKELEDKL